MRFLPQLRRAPHGREFGPFLSQLTKLPRAKVVAGSRHAWWLKFGWNDQREGAIPGMSAEISQISDVPGLDGVVNLFPYWVE